MITGYRKLAKISATPGKTQLINHFSINSDWFLTDLPGYGFARVSKSVKKDWDKMICEYLSGRKNLMYTFVLIDPRIPPQSNDQHFIHWLGTQHIPFVIVFTKCDKLGLAEIQSNLSAWKKQLLETWEDLPMMIYTSSRFGKGRDEILQLIQKTNRLFRNEDQGC